MSKEKNKMPFFREFNKVCKETVEAYKPNRSHRRRLEAFRPKLQALLNDPYHAALAENRLKMLNVILHYVKSTDAEQLERSMVALTRESAELSARLDQKIIQRGGK